MIKNTCTNWRYLTIRIGILKLIMIIIYPIKVEPLTRFSNFMPNQRGKPLKKRNYCRSLLFLKFTVVDPF